MNNFQTRDLMKKLYRYFESKIGRYEDVLENPLDLATRFSLDLFLGISIFLSNIKNMNGLGRKADKLLSGIDPFLLLDRKKYLASLRAH